MKHQGKEILTLNAKEILCKTQFQYFSSYLEFLLKPEDFLTGEKEVGELSDGISAN